MLSPTKKEISELERVDEIFQEHCSTVHTVSENLNTRTVRILPRGTLRSYKEINPANKALVAGIKKVRDLVFNITKTLIIPVQLQLYTIYHWN